MTSLTSIKNSIEEIKPYLQSKYDIENLYIFGSYAREEQTEKSDIDILADFTKTPDLLTFIEIEEYLSSQLQEGVDLVPKRKLKTRLKEKILREAIEL
jgi:predicted nucleotidyltransferase